MTTKKQAKYEKVLEIYLNAFAEFILEYQERNPDKLKVITNVEK